MRTVHNADRIMFIPSLRHDGIDQLARFEKLIQIGLVLIFCLDAA